MSTLPSDPVAIATHMLASDHMRRHAVNLSVDQVIAMAANLWELHQVAAACGRYLSQQSADRASLLFVSPEITASHDALAEALEELGYVKTRKDTDHVE